MDLQEKYAAIKDRFAIVAINSSTVAGFDFAAMDAKLADHPLVKKKWKGRTTLPFTVLLDDARATFKAYDVGMLPYTILIDPEGRVQPGSAMWRGSETRFAKELAKLLAEHEAAVKKAD